MFAAMAVLPHRRTYAGCTPSAAIKRRPMGQSKEPYILGRREPRRTSPRTPLAFDWHPILTLPHIVASAVTISVRATRHSIGGPQTLKPITHFRRNVRELPAVHRDGSGRAN